MDSITHVFLGSAIAQTLTARRIGHPRAFLVGAIAASLPDFDVFVYTSNEMTNHALHRTFMHSLLLVPILAALAVVPFFFHKRSRSLLAPLYLAAITACVSHTLLDTLTSYGTMIFWPFSTRRFALDIIAVIDPLYTLPLILGVLLAWRYKRTFPSAAALALSCAYLLVATLQHTRAQDAQRQLLASRHVTAPSNPRVLPQVGAVVSYRSIYIERGQIHADAIRVPFFGEPRFKSGGIVPLFTAANLHPPTSPNASSDLETFTELADGFIARSPSDSLLIADQRYTYTPEGLEPVWGLQLENTSTPLFRITPRWKYFGILLRDLFYPKGYTDIPPSPAEN